MRRGYNAFGMYNDADDPRLIVPKEIAVMGWTINLGHPRARAALAMIVLTVAGAAILGLKT